MAAGKPKPFNCKACKWGKFCDSSNPAPFDMWVIEDVITSRTCILPMITERSWQFVRLFRQYRRNILPLSGGWEDQPHSYRQAMEILEPVFAELEVPDLPNGAL